MKPRKTVISAILAILCVMACSCSTTRSLQDGEYRLTKNVIRIENEKEINSGALQQYVYQRPGPWNPLMCVYNWAGKKDSALSRFFRKIGDAPVIYDPELVELSAENIRNRLDHLGYYNSDVRTDIVLNRKKVRTVYTVTPGTRYPIRSVSFHLPERGGVAADFLSDTLMLGFRAGAFLSESMLEKEADKSVSRLRAKGYFGMNKNFYSFEADTVTFPGEAVLDMYLREYTRNESEKDAAEHRKFRFGKVAISHPESFEINERMLRNFNTIRPGEEYSEEAVNASYARFSALRSLSSVSISLEAADSATVNCDIMLTPAKQLGFKMNLEASSNSSGLFGISPELSFFHRNVFKRGELLNLSFMGNFQFKPKHNVRSTEFGYSAGLSLPRFVGLPYSLFKGPIPRTDISLAYNYQNRPEYTRNIVSASYGYSGYHGNLNYQFSPLQLNIVKLNNISEDFLKKLSTNPFMLNSYQDHFDLGLGAALLYTTNSDINPKTPYHYARLQFGLAGNLLSCFGKLMERDENGAATVWNTPYSQYVRAELTLGKTWMFGRNDNLAIASRILAGAGYAYGNSSVLPFEQHFYAGGANSLRGWQARSVGPGLSRPNSSFIIPNQSGDMRLEANAEFRFPLVWKLNGALFADAGNIWTLQENEAGDGSPGKLSSSVFLNSIAADWGIGLRIDLSIILIRFDLGLQVHDPSELSGERWKSPREWLVRGNQAIHFGVGYPF